MPDDSTGEAMKVTRMKFFADGHIEETITETPAPATDTPAARRADGIGIALAILAATKNVDALYDAAKSLLDRAAAAEARAAKAEAAAGIGNSKVTRFEVIDHRADTDTFGRALVAWDVAVSLSYQDGGRTLKVFVDDPRPA